MRVRSVNECAHARSRARDRSFQRVGSELADSVHDERPHEHLRTSQERCDADGEHEPQQAVAAGIGERLEETVERTHAVRCLPVLEVPVPAEHGTVPD